MAWQTRFHTTPLSPETNLSLSENTTNRQQNNEPVRQEIGHLDKPILRRCSFSHTL
jgi:hypothetical protein